MLIDSPYFPDELEALPGGAGAGRLRAGRAAGHARRLRPPARPARLPRHDAGRRREPIVRLHRRARARRSASCARTTTSSTSAARAAGARPVPGAAGAGQARDRRRASSSCTPPRATPRTAWRVFAALGGVLVCGDYLSDVEIPWTPRLARPTTARRSRGWRRWSSGRRRSCPGHGAPHDRDTALRILEEDVAYLDALERGRAAAARGARHQGPARDPRRERREGLAAAGIDRVLPGAEAVHADDLVALDVEQVSAPPATSRPGSPRRACGPRPSHSTLSPSVARSPPPANSTGPRCPRVWLKARATASLPWYTGCSTRRGLPAPTRCRRPGCRRRSSKSCRFQRLDALTDASRLSPGDTAGPSIAATARRLRSAREGVRSPSAKRARARPRRPARRATCSASAGPCL